MGQCRLDKTPKTVDVIRLCEIVHNNERRSLITTARQHI